MLHRIIVGAAAVSFAFMALVGGADAAPHKAAPAKTKPAVVAAAPTGDQGFVSAVQMGNDLEIRLGNMILRQGISAHLRDFGMMIVHDHTMLKNELSRIANGAHFKQPSGIDAGMAQTCSALAKKSGMAFDKAMWGVLVEGHQHAVAAFKAEIANGHNKELVAWARQRLPMIEKHLRVALQEVGPKKKK
jgi:putative membrane protein